MLSTTIDEMLTGEVQCAIAVFEGLFPSLHDKIIHELLFELAMQHGFAKLHLHTELSIAPLRSQQCGSALTFSALSQSPVKHSICRNCLLRKPLEDDGRQHWQRNRGLPQGHVAKSSDEASTKPKKRKRKKRFNLSMYKLHVLGDYVEAI